MINFNDKFGVVVEEFDEYKAVLEFLFDKGYDWFSHSFFGIGEPHELNKEEIFDSVDEDEYIIITFDGEDDTIGFITESQRDEWIIMNEHTTVINFEDFTHDPEFMKYLEKPKDGEDSPVTDGIGPKKTVLKLPDNLVKILENIHDNYDYPLNALVDLESSKQEELIDITSRKDERLILAYLSGDKNVVLSSSDTDSGSEGKYILVGTDDDGDNYFLTFEYGRIESSYNVDDALSGTKEELKEYKSDVLEYQPLSEYL